MLQEEEDSPIEQNPEFKCPPPSDLLKKEAVGAGIESSKAFHWVAGHTETPGPRRHGLTCSPCLSEGDHDVLMPRVRP